MKTNNLKICVITFYCKFMFQLFDLSILMVIIYFNLQIYNDYQLSMAKMRYADIPKDVSIDNFPSLNVSEVTLSLIKYLYLRIHQIINIYHNCIIKYHFKYNILYLINVCIFFYISYILIFNITIHPPLIYL